MKSWMFTAWGSLYKKFIQLAPSCKNAVIRERTKLNRMTGYLASNCNEKLTLAGMAEACQVSTGDFCRFFKKHMGMTPFEYLQKCRIWNSMDAVIDKTASMARLHLQWVRWSKLFLRDFPQGDGMLPCGLPEVVQGN